MERTFTRMDTKAVKGVAVFCMVAHHLFYSESRRPIGMPEIHWTLDGMIAGMSLESALVNFVKIVVSAFFFFSGYGLYKQAKKGSFKLEKKILGLYTEYWKVFFIFIPIGFVFFHNQPDYFPDTLFCHVFQDFHLQDVASALLCWTTPYNQEWGFISVYLFCIVAGYIYYRLTEGRKLGFWVELLLVLIIEFGVNGVQFLPQYGFLPVALVKIFPRGLTFGCSVFMGIVFARYDVLDTWVARGVDKFTKLGIAVFSLGILVGMVYMRLLIIQGADADLVFTPLFIIAWAMLLRVLPPLYKLMAFLGKYSTGIWLIHTFYCYYYYPTVLLTHISGYLWLDFVILMAMSVVSAMAVDKFWSLLPVRKAIGLLKKAD